MLPSPSRKLLILWTVLAGVILMSNEVSCLRGSALVAELKAKAKAALNAPTETVIEVVTIENNSTGNATNVTVTKTKSLLTGIPQKDYIYDPNLPRELNGHNLTNYPFYNAVPEDIDFKCDGLHDGFYASVPHKCQVYHHCLFGTRYDFLCANYTAFDQKTFICHFVSEVDCENSPKYYKRNEALYKAATTSAPPPSTTKVTTTTTSSTPAPGQTARPRRRRPYRRRRPVYEYYFDDQYDDDEYYDEDIVQPPRRKPTRKNRPQGNHRGKDDEDYDSTGQQNTESKDTAKPSVRPNGPGAGTVYDRPRVPPKIRRPVPLNEREKYDYTPKTTEMGPPPTQDTGKHRSQSKKQQRDDDYYDEDYEEEQPKPKKSKPVEYDIEPRRSNGRHRTRQHSRRRPDRYSDDYDDDEDERPLRPSRKQGRYDNHPRSSRPSRYRGFSRDDHEEAVPAERPGYISGGRLGSVGRKRLEPDNNRGGSRKNNGRPIYEDEDEEEYYYDDDASYEDEVASRRSHRPGRYNGRVPISEDDYEDDTRGRKTHESGNSRKNSGSSGKSNKSASQGESPGSSKRLEKLSENRNRNEKPISNVDSAKYKDIIQDYGKEEDYDDEYEDKPLHETPQTKGRGEENIKSHPSENNYHDNNSTVLTDSVPDTKDSVKFSQPSTNFRSPISSEQIYSPRSTNRKTSVEEITTNTPKFKVSSTTAYSDSEYDDEVPRYSNFRPKIEMKARIVPPTPLLNNYRKPQTTINPIVDGSTEIIGTDDKSYDLTEKSNDQQDKEYFNKNEKAEEKFSSPVTSRPFVSIFRRPLKTAITNTSVVEPNFSSQKNVQVVASNLRRPVKEGEDDKNLPRKTLPAGAFRRVKIDSSKPVNSDTGSQKASQSLRRPNIPSSDILNSGIPSPTNFDSTQSRISAGSNFRRFNKIVDLTTTEIPVADSYAEDIENQPSAPDTSVKKIKTADIRVREYEDNVQSQQSRSSIGTNFKGPYSVNNISTNPDDLPKFLLPIHRLNKQQNTQSIPFETTSEDYVSSTLPPVRNDGNYRRPEPGAAINLRTNFGYFSSKRGKQPLAEDIASGSATSPTQGTRTNKEPFLKQPPKVEITAPGPSEPDNDPTTAKSNFRNNYNDAQSPVSDYGFHISDEEYDVTLNDALQPSTLHPTRSLGDYEQNRLKSRGFQPAVVHPAIFTNRQTSFLLPAASQQYITRIQSAYPQTKPMANPDTRYIDKTHDKFIQITPQGQHEYEAVVISAPSSQQWNTQQNSRPTEWLW